MWLQPEPANWWHAVEDALAEDIGSGDMTSACLPPDLMVEWEIEAQAEGRLAGIGIVDFLLAPYGNDPENCDIRLYRKDGEKVSRGDVLASGYLPARKAMMHERCALNFLMMLSGVATLTAEFVARTEGTSAKIVDTRKTVPNLRSLQKYAVRCGGGHNHRMGLYDGVMLKDNHIAAYGSISGAVAAVRAYMPHTIRIEVECENPDQVRESVDAGVDIVMLDNMDPFMMRDVVKAYTGRVLLEASGGVNLDTVRGIAMTGVDFISVGALTHSATFLSMHMEIR